MVRKYFFGWFGLLAIAMFNGFLRQFSMRRISAILLAHQISVFHWNYSLCSFLSGFLKPRWPLASAHQAWDYRRNLADYDSKF